MPTEINSYAFCADFSAVADCLFAIQASDDNGGFAHYTEVLNLLNSFENDLLKKLYNTVIRVFGALEGVVITQEYLLGDFEYLDFSDLDFYTGFLDQRNTGYSSRFQTILNVFKEFCGRSAELSDADIQNLNNVFVPVLDAFTAIQNYLIGIGFNLCTSTVSYYNNADNLYLQATGSDGSDGVAQGLHLRWSLAGNLGQNHLPQGNYYNDSAATSGYNKANDFVQLSRTPYVNPVLFTIDFQTARPAIDTAELRWTYILNLKTDNAQTTNLLRLTFTDAAQYHSAAAIIDPRVQTFGFLRLYLGVIEFEVDNKNLFSFGYDFRVRAGLDTGTLKIQAISVSDVDGVNAETINMRKTVTATANNYAIDTVTGDNIVKIQMKRSQGSYLQSFSFETYDDFVKARTATDWTVVGSDFALSLTDQLVFDRLENTSVAIDNAWPQYINGTRVRAANYRDKWQVSRVNDPSIREAVQQYLSLSETDPRAEDVVRDEGADPASPGLLISYLDVLNALAIDYHWARMLGLGHIDTSVNGEGETKFIYKITYTNRQSLSSPQMITGEYMSLPTGQHDSRLPLKPLMRPLSYNMAVNNNLTETVFNDEGYAFNANIRLINIGRELYNAELTSQDYLDDYMPVIDFDIFENTPAVSYGIAYKLATAPNYVKPEITSEQTMGTAYNAYDSEFPSTGIPESVPVPDNATSLYVHFEKNVGVHAYAIYGINWFSRTSALSDEVQTDETIFPVANTLQPPTALTAQYIQKEDTLLFTTATEQNWLTARMLQFPGEDTSFTRITFNWLDIVDLSYLRTDISSFDFSTALKPNKVNAWFKPTQPLQIVGVITGVSLNFNDRSQYYIATEGCTFLDGSSSSTVVDNENLARFTGSLLITPEGQFKVVSANIGNGGIGFVIERYVQLSAVESSDGSGQYSTIESYQTPIVRSRFTITENLANTENWQAIAEAVSLVSWSDNNNPVVEADTDDQGNTSRYLIGGISADAVISQLYATDNQAVMPGYYSVEFANGVNLTPHPQQNLPFDPARPDANTPLTLQTPYVEWYNGQIRIPLANDATQKKLLDVIRIVQTSPVVVYIYDAAYQDNPIKVSANNTDWVNQVNYHPGYKAYLFPEPSPDYTFNGANILPGAADRDKKTMIALQTADLGANQTGFVSTVSSPAILLARKIIAPVKLDAPLISPLKVRPDATGRAALTFDIKIAPDDTGARTPFGFRFYRTSNEDVLESLYEAATVTQIVEDLAGLTVDTHFNQRYLDLVNLVFDIANPGHFKVYDAVPQPYGFPLPDKSGLTQEGDSVDVKKAKYLDAVTATLLPLTAQTPVYALLKQGYQTENKQPVTRTIDGLLLDPTDPEFDAFPMVRKYQDANVANTTYARFTDYTLYASSRFLYFYGASEVTDQLVIGPLGLFGGPVSILHTLQAEAPIIRYFTLGPPQVESDVPMVVNFFITPFSAEDPISKVRVYRTLDLSKASSLQTMDSYIDLDAVPDTVDGIIATDLFSNLSPIPYGEVIYYRLAFVRTIINEKEIAEDVVGLGSEIITVNLIDTTNPPVPQLEYDNIANKLSWLPTTNKGTYYLYQQNNRGNWQSIYTVKPISPSDKIEYLLSDPLPPTDANGNTIYYRFKVKVQNASGLFNLTDNELTINN